MAKALLEWETIDVTQLDDIMQATITDNNSQFDTQFEDIIFNIVQRAFDCAAQRALDNIVGDNRLLDDNG